MTLPDVSTKTRMRTVPCSSLMSASRGYSGFSQPAEPSETPRVTPAGLGAAQQLPLERVQQRGSEKEY